jgi:murein DD-endopeptidase MepM/ murein hydrolase activator NlpD
MARLKHQPTRPDSGFSPIQLGRGEISRMREETNRVVQNMEKNRLAQLEQGKTNLQALRDDADYTRRAEARNFEIQQQNLKVGLVQSQLDAQTAQRQSDVNVQAAEQVFGGLAKFSQTAANEAEKRRIKEEEFNIEREYSAASQGLDAEASIDYKNMEAINLQLLEKWEGTLNVEEAQGGDPNAISKGRIANPALTNISNKGKAAYILTNQYPIALQATLNNTETQFEFNGQMVTFADARSNPELMSVVAQIVKNNLLKTSNLWGLDGRFLAPGLRVADAHALSQIKAASDTQTKNTYAMREDEIFGMVRNNVDGLRDYGPTAFRMWANDPNLGYSGALGNYEKLATDRDQNGNFRFSMEDLASLDLKSNGRTFAEEWPGRWTSMQEARVKSQIEYDSREIQRDNIAYQQDTKRIMDGLNQDPTQANAQAAIKFFVENHQGRIPAELSRFESTYTIEAIQKAEAIKKLEAIPPGLVTREAVEAAAALDPAVATSLQQRYEAQEARYNAGIYKETAESFKATANGVTSFGTNKPNTPSSVFLQERMKAEYRARVDRAVAGGMDFQQASTTIGQALDAEVKAGARDPNSPWYRKADAPGGAAQFPNLNKGSLPALEQANRRFADLKKNIRTNGLQKVVDTKGSIITAEEAPAIVNNYGKPGFSIPQDVLAVAGMSNGLDPMVIINRQLTALGMAPLQPPPSMATTGQLVSPAFQKLLYRTPTVERSARALGSTNTFNPTVVPNNLGPLIQQSAQANGVNPAHIAALAEIESGFKADNISYNGSSFGVMQIHRASHPAYFAQNDWRTPQANIEYGTRYFKQLLDRYKDPVVAAMAYNAGPGDYDAYLQGQMPDGPKKTEMLNHGKKFAKALYKYGGGAGALNHTALMRNGSAVGVSMPARDLRTFSPQVSSVTFDTGQPGIDIFFEDKQFPAVLPGIVKDVSFQGTSNSGYGNYIVIESTDPETGEKVDVLYAHLAARPNLNPGQAIRTGQIIGQQGGTGRVVSADGTIASIDFLRPAARGSKDMTPYRNYQSLRNRIAGQLRSI